jgi:hypothetical protein
MRQQLMGRYVSQDMITAVRSIKAIKGGRVFLVVGEKMAAGCSNCNGNGQLHLQTIIGGPFEAVPQSVTNNKTHTVPTFIEGKWYQVRLRGYECPVCGGAQLVSKMEEDIQNSQIDSLTGDMKMKNSYRQGANR